MGSNRYSSLSDDELREIALQKNKSTGVFKRSAIAAQRELWDRYHWSVSDICVADDVCDRDLSDVQYNG